MDPLLTMSGARLAGVIRAGEVTSREVVEAHIARVRAVNPTLNAVVRDRFEVARREADRADETRRATPPEALPPLHGVPCTIKECFALEGMPQTGGLVARASYVADGDAPTVARLRAAGAIPIGITNVSELCMWFESSNRVYGRTNNPYDPRRIVGGSSGGEGAIVGAGASPFGLGADIGGSIRMPAFFNGVFGHKPSAGLVPSTGQYPCAENDALRLLSTGPLARRAEDLMPLLRVLAGPDGEDHVCCPMALGDPDAVDLAGLTVLDVDGDGATRVTDDLRRAQRCCAEHLASRGATVRVASFARLRRAFELWAGSLAAAGGTPFGVLLGNGRPVRALPQLALWALRRSPHTLPALGLALLETVAKAAPARVRRAVEEADDLRRELTDAIGPAGVMLYPPFPQPAPRHYAPLARPFRPVFTMLFNVMGFPVTQVPLGLNDDGIPIGVQVASIHGHDHVTIAVAQELERAFGGWVPPPRLGA
jgi:fatty acid amide hydrolase 2